jgi:hypothetical protein
MTTQKLRIGLLVDTCKIPAWLYWAIEQVEKSNSAYICVVIKAEADRKASTPADRKSNQKNGASFIYRSFNWLDQRLFLKGTDAWKEVDLHAKLSNVPVITIRQLNHAGSSFKEDELRKVRDLDLDIWIGIGYQLFNSEIASAARYGIWFYDLSIEHEQPAGPAGFWEVIQRRPYTESALWVRRQGLQNDWAVYRSRSLTHLFSPARNRNTAAWLAASFLPRQINRIFRAGGARFFQETVKYNTAPKIECRPDDSFSAPQIFCGYTRLFFRNLYELWQRATRRDMWYLMVDFSPSPQLAYDQFINLFPPGDRFWADPHVVQKDGRFFIFIEELIYQNQKGHISVIEMDSSGQYKSPVPVLKSDHHLSYPFVFDYQNKLYMVPESGQGHSIDLYECVDFPYQWKFNKHLMEKVNAVDTTLYFHDGKWWMFTGITENIGALPEVELFLFYADDLFTMEWKSHPLNPVISDVTCARPAGPLFEQDGKIIRPSQDCSRNYGYAFNLNEIICLSETEYQEKKITTVKPDWDRRLIATHTYSRAPGVKVIDGLIRRSKFK